MDREIVFRGKRVDDVEWVAGGYAEFEGKPYIVVIYRVPDEGEIRTGIIEVIPETVGQYTGLKDKYGGKFDGDIFQADDDECIQRYVIAWDNDSLEWQAHSTTDLFCTLSLSEFRAEDIQVIGNIFDNPSLLEGGES